MATRTGGRRRIIDWERIVLRCAGVVVGLVLATAALIAVIRANPQIFFWVAERLPRTYEPISPNAGDDGRFFKYGAIGNEANEGIPYRIWAVLPKVCHQLIGGDSAGAASQGSAANSGARAYAAFGFTYEDGRDTPIGISRTVVGVNPLGLRLGIEQVAINCATCHVQTYTLPGDAKPRIFVGGSNNRLQSQRYVRFLAACAETPGFETETVLTAMHDMSPMPWYERQMYRYLVIPLTRGAIQTQLGSRFAWTWRQTEWGPGRMSPFNPVKFSYLEQPIDDTIDLAEVMPAWHVADKEKLRSPTLYHWDGLSADLKEVVLNSALGDGMTHHGHRTGTIDRLISYLRSLKSPPSPVVVDTGLREQGALLFERLCAECHAPDGKRTLTIIPRDEIATDPGRIDMWTPEAAAAYNNYDREGKDPRFNWSFERFKKHDGYLAQPLWGIWLTGPYLHNGSVPTLDDLLKPARQRPKAFIRGTDAIDLVRGGYAAPACVPGTYGADASRGFCYDTTARGNGNQGHEYGAELGEAERRALVHYLMTL